jgi:hypothetical protein
MPGNPRTPFHRISWGFHWNRILDSTSVWGQELQEFKSIFISIDHCKKVGEGPSRIASRLSKITITRRWFFPKFQVFDSLLILHYSTCLLVVWSTTNVGNTIELLWGQIEATQVVYHKIQIFVSFNILGIRRNWGQIRAPGLFLFKTVCSLFILMNFGGGPVRWGPPEKMTGARVLGVWWNVSWTSDLVLMF